MQDNYIMYLRKSRADQGYDEESIDLTLSRHRERLMELCDSMSIKCSVVLQEVGSADSIAARPEMMKLLQLVETGAYAGVVCIDMDRLSRGSGADQALVINTFKYSDTKVITPAKTYDFSLETDEQFAELSLFLAKQEYRAIKKRLYQGRLDSTKEGKWQSAKAPFGYETYKLKGQKGFSLRIVPEEAEMVRLIFKIYLDERIGCAAIGRKMQALGYCNRVSNVWHQRFVHNILSNPVYTGKVRFSRFKYTTMIEGGEVVHRTIINRNPYIYEGLHEPIIDQETFDRAQRQLYEKTVDKTHSWLELRNPRTRILRCGYCGAACKYQGITSGKKRPLIKCRTTGCKCHGAKFELVEDRILRGLDQWLRDYEFGTDSGRTDDGMEKTIKFLSDKENSLKAKLARQMDAYENGVYDLESYRARSTQTQAEIDAVETQIEDIEKKISERAEIIPKIRNVTEVYRSLDSAKEKNRLLSEVLEKVEFKKDSYGRGHEEDFEIILYPKVSS